MNKTISAIRCKIQLAVQQLSSDQHKLDKEMDTVRRSIQEKEKILQHAGFSSTTVHPELETMRRDYIQKVFYSMAAMENKLGKLQQKKEEPEWQEIKLKKRMRIIDKILRKKT